MEQKKEVSDEQLRMIHDLMDKGKFEEAKKLIPAQCRRLPLVSKVPGSEWSLLHYAIWRGGYDIVKYLLDGEADLEINHATSNATPLYIAAQEGDEKCCELLLDRGANIEARVVGGATPLIAASDKHESVCKLLLTRGADVNAVDNLGCTALHLAVFSDNVSVAKLLISKGAQQVKTKKGKQTPLDIAKRRGFLDMISLLK